MKIRHHGAVDGVTGSCHELCVDSQSSLLIDCGLFQGAETSPDGARDNQLEIDFPLDNIKALLATHVHIDHVGRIPQLLAAGFQGPIFCSRPSALLLPLVLEDAVKIGFTRNRRTVQRFINEIERRLVPLPYRQWTDIDIGTTPLSIRLQPAGHILGSSYIECRVGRGKQQSIAVFSGDLGAPWTPLLPAPRPPHRADVLVIESTYGDRLHDKRRDRQDRLARIIEHALKNQGSVLIPAFSIGRTQELLYELEAIIHHKKQTANALWRDLNIIVDSPLASRFTSVYRKLKPYWDKEARRRVTRGRHPLSFKQLTTIDSHARHQRLVKLLAEKAYPAVVIAASGMCAGGRIVNYLKAMIEDARHDILFVGYQARGTPGQAIQDYGPRHGYVELDGQRFTIHAKVHTIPGYSAHADQANLIRFATGIRKGPREIRLVHGDAGAKRRLRRELASRLPDTKVVIP